MHRLICEADGTTCRIESNSVDANAGHRLKVAEPYNAFSAFTGIGETLGDIDVSALAAEVVRTDSKACSLSTLMDASESLTTATAVVDMQNTLNQLSRDSLDKKITPRFEFNTDDSETEEDSKEMLEALACSLHTHGYFQEKPEDDGLQRFDDFVKIVRNATEQNMNSRLDQNYVDMVFEQAKDKSDQWNATQKTGLQKAILMAAGEKAAFSETPAGAQMDVPSNVNSTSKPNQQSDDASETLPSSVSNSKVVVY